MEVNERITQLRKSLGLSQTDFGKTLGVSRGIIKNIDEHHTTPKPEFIDLICRTHNVNPDWLMTGEGNMLKTESETDRLFRLAKEILNEPDTKRLLDICELVAQLRPEEAEAAIKFMDSLKTRRSPEV